MLNMVGWNRTVLELGAAAGHMTRALNDQDCRVTAIEYDPAATVDLKQFADEVIVGDLNDPNVFSGIPTWFDVILAGDVLEHLINPQQVLSRAARLLLPGGKIVVSLPNIGHVDVRLSLLQGRFDYTPYGLLDATHLRFFTLKTIEDLARKSGLVITELKRVRVPAFETELALERSSVPDRRTRSCPGRPGGRDLPVRFHRGQIRRQSPDFAAGPTQRRPRGSGVASAAVSASGTGHARVQRN